MIGRTVPGSPLNLRLRKVRTCPHGSVKAEAGIPISLTLLLSGGLYEALSPNLHHPTETTLESPLEN